MNKKIEYIIVPDGTYEYVFPHFNTGINFFTQDLESPDKPMYVYQEKIEYNYEFKKFWPVTFYDKKYQIIWKSEYEKMNEKRANEVIKEFGYYLENVFIKKLRKAGFTNIEIAKIIEAIESTCNVCWDTDLDKEVCYCMRDD